MELSESYCTIHPQPFSVLIHIYEYGKQKLHPSADAAESFRIIYETAIFIPGLPRDAGISFGSALRI